MWQTVQTKIALSIGYLLLMLLLPAHAVAANVSGEAVPRAVQYGISGTPLNDSSLRTVLGRGVVISVNATVSGPGVVLWDEAKTRGGRSAGPSSLSSGTRNQQGNMLSISGQ